MNKHFMETQWALEPSDDQDIDSVAVMIVEGCLVGAGIDMVRDDFNADALSRKQRKKKKEPLTLYCLALL